MIKILSFLLLTLSIVGAQTPQWVYDQTESGIHVIQIPHSIGRSPTFSVHEEKPFYYPYGDQLKILPSATRESITITPNHTLNQSFLYWTGTFHMFEPAEAALTRTCINGYPTVYKSPMSFEPAIKLPILYRRPMRNTASTSHQLARYTEHEFVIEDRASPIEFFTHALNLGLLYARIIVWPHSLGHSHNDSLITPDSIMPSVYHLQMITDASLYEDYLRVSHHHWMGDGQMRSPYLYAAPDFQIAPITLGDQISRYTPSH